MGGRAAAHFHHYHVMGFDCELAAFWHSVAGIHGQSDNYLLDLPGSAFIVPVTHPPET